MAPGTRGLALTNIYDPTFFIEDRIVYSPLSDNIESDGELSLNAIVNILANDSILQIKNIDNTYSICYFNGEYTGLESAGIDDYYYYRTMDINGMEIYSPIKKDMADCYI
jgi:hypothetical protein